MHIVDIALYMDLIIRWMGVMAQVFVQIMVLYEADCHNMWGSVLSD